MNDTWWRGEHQLDEDQRQVIALPPAGSHLILGPPGSGKTNLLLLRANYLHRTGLPNVIFLVFTKTLQEFLVAGAEKYSFASEKIQTYAYWQRKFLADNGITPKVGSDFETARAELLLKLKELIAKECLTEVYDAIVLDEAQDYSTEEIEMFSKLTSRLFVAADAKQSIYKQKGTVEYLKSIIESVIELKYHYRNGEKICKVADHIARASALNELLFEFSNYDESKRPSEATLIRQGSMELQCAEIANRLKIQTDAYPEELLGVLCPTLQEVTAVASLLSKSQIADKIVVQKHGDYVPFHSDRMICICTIHSAKGLEFRAVHLPSIERIPVFQDRQRRVAYTAVTRAKTTLTAYCTKNPPGYFESAFASLLPRNPASISTAFGK